MVIKNTFETFLMTKLLQQGLKSVYDSLSLVPQKYSLNNFCSQPETNVIQNRFATSIL